MPGPYSVEFRRDVVAVALKREVPLAQIAKDFGVCSATLHSWLKQARTTPGEGAFGGAGFDANQIRQLQKRNRLLEQENEVLRRAAAYLSQANLPKK